ncbi:unnamed protein product [Heterotrigona itama]|uniref:Phospholipase B1, membrane-associated n=1 Tax=Heterotrigona itama TaxID=395501 RepID=A0A6V7HH24_9HYME|nr:unnamed protein product [Heterotrigona itama]
MKKLCLCLLLQLCAVTMAKETILDIPIIRRTYRGYRNWLSQTYGGRSSNVPKSVHRLRPGDIDVIAAMGDSLTVSTAVTAVSVFQMLVENRGISGSIGGQETWRKYLTFPNILKEFNPKLIGYSLGDSVSIHPDAQLNVGETGAMSEDMPFMAKYLVKKIKNDLRIDVNKDWKLISLMIGSNDFCQNMCEGPSPWSMLKKHKIELINTLRILKDNLPRTFVALIPPPYLKLLVEYHRQHVWLCRTMSIIECPCLFSLKFQHQKLEYYEVIRRWQDLEIEIASYPEFYRDDFTVEILPFLRNSTIPLDKDGYQDMSYFAVDCFHWNANGIWNNLLEPADNRTIFSKNIFERFLCPTSKSPYLTTHKNRQEINKARD